MKRTNKLSLRIAMLMIAIMGTVNATLADDITVGEVSNSDCSHTTRAENVAGHPILKLTRSEIGLVGELRDYRVNCGYGDVNVLCEEDGENLTIVVDDDAGEHMADCTCPINIYFTLFNATQDEFQLKVRGRSEINVGTISFEGHTMVEIDLMTLVILYDESFEYPLKAQNFRARITDNVNLKDVSQKLYINHENEIVLSCAYKYYILPLDYSYLNVKATLDDDSTLVIDVLTDGIPENGKRIGELYFDIVNTFKDAYHLKVNQTFLLGNEDEQTTCIYEGDITVPLFEEVTIPLAPTSTSLYIEPLWYYVDLFTKTASVLPSDTYKSLSNIVILPSVELREINCTVDKIEDSAFNGLTDLESITIPESVREIGNQAFQDCRGLTSVSLPSSLVFLGDASFRDCRALTSITLPDGLTSIGWRTFYACLNLKEIDIPDSVTNIDDDAFAFSEKLEEVYCRATTPPYTNNNRQFRRCNPEATLHVPAASLQVYKETAPWCDFKYIVPLETEPTYRPFVEDDKVWKVGAVNSGNPVQWVEYFYFDGDTIIDGKTCKQMMRQRYINSDFAESNSISQDNSLSYVGAWYEENKQVYKYDPTNEQFKLMYDFSVDANDTLQIDNLFYVVGPKQTGGMEGFKGVYRDVRLWADGESIYSVPWLEGVGSTDAPITNVYPGYVDPAWFLMACVVDDEVIFLNDVYEDGATPEVMGVRNRFDFTHTIKTKPQTPRRGMGIAEAEVSQVLSLYGEYNQQLLDINLNPLVETYLVRITDETGKAVYEKTINAGSIVALNIDISNYAEGRYTVTVENNYETFVGEFDTQTTGISDAERLNDNERMINDIIYNLQGQRIKSLQKGLNIVNGRKIINGNNNKYKNEYD